MAIALSSDIQDLLNCIVCLEDYDAKLRVPKMLTCHHSICLPCLKAFQTKTSICCPTCRCVTKVEKTLEDLPTNFYILPIIIMIETIQENLPQSSLDASWVDQVFNSQYSLSERIQEMEAELALLKSNTSADIITIQ